MLRIHLLHPSVLVAVVTCCGLVVLATGLPGCGGTTEQVAGPDLAPPAGEDVCILAGELPPEKAGAPHAAPPPATEKVTLTVDAYWHDDSVLEYSWERHRFLVKAGNYYAVEVCPLTLSGDDPDLYLSRDPDPYTNSWRMSASTQHSELIVFKAGTTGVMYAGVQGSTGGGDVTCEYGIRVRMCHFKVNTG